MPVLTFRGTELREISDDAYGIRRWFSITSGWRDGLEVRGQDVTLVGNPGMYELNRIAKWRVVHLEGVIVASDESNWDDEMATLEALFDPTLGSGDLEVTSPYMGLSAGSRVISARVANYITADVVPQLVTSWDVTLHSITNPPDWEVGGS